MDKRTFKKKFNEHMADRNIRDKDRLENEILELVKQVEKEGNMPSWKYLEENHSKIASFIRNNDKSIKKFFSHYFEDVMPYKKKKKSIVKRDRGGLVIEKKTYFNKIFIDQTILEIKRFNDMSALYKREIVDSVNDDIEFVPNSFILVLEKLSEIVVEEDGTKSINQETLNDFKREIYDTHKLKGDLSLYNPLYLRYRKNVFSELLKEFNIVIKEQ